MTACGPPARTRVRERLEREEVAVVVAGHAVPADTADFVGRFGFDGYWLEAEQAPQHGTVRPTSRVAASCGR
jgi:hypothetical protein